jgi:HTH-type transcriptional regulator/antitoxin HigA
MKDPIDHINDLLEARGWTRRYLLPAFGGSRSRMSEAMGRKRPLSLSQIRCFVINFGMKAEDMIRWYPTKYQPKEPVTIYDVIDETKKAASSKVRLKSVA